MKKKVFVGLSGGVDSAVSALLLKNQGYEVTGVFMKNWSGDDYGIADLCPWEDDLRSAREVADFLKIPLKVYNFEKDYRKLVIEDFFKQYELGNTPNPDVLCNKYIKFDKFLEKALDEGADYIATGHYAKTIDGKLFRAKDYLKDQTYFLHQVTGKQLEKSIFPLGEYTKKDVRMIAEENSLPNAKRPDSQGICFIGEVDITNFLKNRLKEKTGKVMDIDTKKVIGEHNGVWFYTIGQRKGIGIGGSQEPYFVCSKDVKENVLYAAKGKRNSALWSNEVRAKNIHLINEGLEIPKKLVARIRHRGKLTSVTIDKNISEPMLFRFNEPVWAPAAGQSIVLYSDELCVGGGEIVA